MKITDIRNKYSEYKISYMSKKDYEIGITDTTASKRRKDIYENVYIASKDKKYWLLYADSGNFTGSFNTKYDTVSWFKNGGR